MEQVWESTEKSTGLTRNKYAELMEKVRNKWGKAQKQYAAKNREKMNAIQHNYYYRHKDDPAYKLMKKEQNWVYREKQKLQKIAKQEELM